MGFLLALAAAVIALLVLLGVAVSFGVVKLLALAVLLLALAVLVGAAAPLVARFTPPA